MDQALVDQALVDQALAAPPPTCSPKTRGSEPPPATLAPRCLRAARSTRRSAALSSNRSVGPHRNNSVTQPSGRQGGCGAGLGGGGGENVYADRMLRVMRDR